MNMLIVYLFIDSNLTGNLANGHNTKRWLSLSEEDRTAEIERVYAEAMGKIQDVPIDDLINSDNIKVGFLNRLQFIIS